MYLARSPLLDALTTAPTAARAAEAVELCKEGLAAQSTLPASLKAKPEGVCDKASKGGDREAVKKAAEEVCQEVVNSSGVPSTGREQVHAA